MLRASQTTYYSKITKKLQNRPGIIGTAGDFLKFWKDVFVGYKKKKNHSTSLNIPSKESKSESNE